MNHYNPNRSSPLSAAPEIIISDTNRGPPSARSNYEDRPRDGYKDGPSIANIPSHQGAGRLRSESNLSKRDESSHPRAMSPAHFATIPEDASIPMRLSTSRSSLSQPPQIQLNDIGEYVISSNPSPASIASEKPRQSRRNSDADSFENETNSYLPALQIRSEQDPNNVMQPLTEEDYDAASYDLLAPVQEGARQFSLESYSEKLFSAEHLEIIFEHSELLLRFTSFLNHNRPASLPLLIYYLDSVKALRAIKYANAIAESLDSIPGYEFSQDVAKSTVNEMLEEKSRKAFEVLVREDLPAYITYIWTSTVSLSITMRISGTLPIHLRDMSEGLAEVFCLTDPSRPDNPIVFASEEFHRTTQYGMSYVIGRNCRFLQGPKTNHSSVRRLREKVLAGEESCEVFLNYRRDGSPFMNLLMTAPLSDSRGKIRYFIGAQIDVSGLVKECSDLESLRILIDREQAAAKNKSDIAGPKLEKDEFRDLSEMLNVQELNTVRRHGGKMHGENQEEKFASNGVAKETRNQPRILIHDGESGTSQQFGLGNRFSGKLSGVYEHYLLVRPYPSLRILFASPSMRVPGILQSPFMSKIGGSPRVREELTQALADGRGVTAKVRWVTKSDTEGRNRWIHCTPLLGINSAIGVWMVVVVDEERDTAGRRLRQAPAVDQRIGRTGESRDRYASSEFGVLHGVGGSPRRSHYGSVASDSLSLRDYGAQNGEERDYQMGRISSSHARKSIDSDRGTASPSWSLKS